MDPSNILALCIAMLIILSIQFLIIASLATHVLSLPECTRYDAEETRNRARSLSSRDMFNTSQPPVPNDNTSSLYSDPPRPDNPVPISGADDLNDLSLRDVQASHFHNGQLPLDRSNNASSFHSNPPRPQNPVPSKRLVEYPSSDDSLTNHI
jgi:hypothetical protein